MTPGWTVEADTRIPLTAAAKVRELERIGDCVTGTPLLRLDEVDLVDVGAETNDALEATEYIVTDVAGRVVFLERSCASKRPDDVP